MSECLSCHGGTAEYEFPVIEIQTLHIRDVKGERYVQAMGEKKELRICSECAKKFLESTDHPIKSSAKPLVSFGILLLVGITALALPKSEEVFVNLFGPIAIVCGLLGIGVTLRNAFRNQKKMGSLNSEDALAEAAWRLALAKAPKKYEDSDLTYVPVNSRTRGMNARQLMEAFDLLQPIAEQVKKKMNPSKTE